MAEPSDLNSRSNSPVESASRSRTASPLAKVFVTDAEDINGYSDMDTLIALDPRVKVRPSYSDSGSVGLDLACLEDSVIKPGDQKGELVDTGVFMRLGKTKAAMMVPRSSLYTHYHLELIVGTLDRSYSGRLFMNVVNRGTEEVRVKAGDRLAQLVIMEAPEVKLHFVDKIPETPRTIGFGHSSGF